MWLCSSVYSEKTMTDLFVTAVACSPNLISAKAWQRRSKKRHAGRALPVSVSAPLLCAGLGFSVSAWRMMSRSNRCDSHILLVRTPRRCCISIFKKEKKKKNRMKDKAAYISSETRPVVCQSVLTAHKNNDFRQLLLESTTCFVCLQESNTRGFIRKHESVEKCYTLVLFNRS